MNRVLVRIILAMLLVPTAVVLYCVTFLILESWLDDEYAFLWTGLLTAAFVGMNWVFIWRRVVHWTAWRKWATVLAAVPFMLFMVGEFLAVLLVQHRYYGGPGPTWSFVCFIAPVLTILAWLFATPLIWAERASERAGRLAIAGGSALFCPRCGYNLTGLYEARCPECGTQYTLNELYAGQRQVEAELADKRECEKQ